jgi:hypothetical protein
MRPFVVVQTPHTSAPLDHSAAIELADTNKGFLPNRLTTAQRDAIVDPAPGLLIYNTSDSVYQFFDGSVWNAIGGGSNNLSGTLTAGQVPVASDAHTLTDSHYEDDGDGHQTVEITDAIPGPDGGTGLLVYGDAGNNGLGLTVWPTGSHSNSYGFIDIFSFGGSSFGVGTWSAAGTPDAPTAISIGNGVGEHQFYGFDGVSAWNTTAQIAVAAAENFAPGKAGVSLRISTRDTVTDNFVRDRVVIDGLGNTNIENGALGIATPATAPAAPASGWLIYCDGDDGDKLKAIASNGTIALLGTP